MNPKNDRPTLEQQPETRPTPRKRFRIEKIEERIAPKKSGSIGDTGYTLSHGNKTSGSYF